MKKSLLLLSTILASGILAGCGEKAPCVNHIDANHNGKCDVCDADVAVNHIDSNKDGKCDVCGADVEIPAPEIDFTKFGWDEKLARIFYEKLGIIPPYVPSTGYKYEYGVDIFGDNYVNTYLFYSTEEIAVNAFNQYYNTCSDAEYIMTLGSVPVDEESYVDGIAFADKVIEGSKAVELTFLDSLYIDESGKKIPALGIFATNYLYIPEDVFPREAIDIALGEHSADIPDLLANDAEYSIFFGYTEADDGKGGTYVDSKYLEIHIYSTSIFDFEEALFNGLNKSKNNKIYVTNDDGEDIYCAEYPGPYYGQEFWCYNITTVLGVKQFMEYCVQFGIASPMYGESYLYMVIYYDIVE